MEEFWERMEKMHEEMERIFEEFFGPSYHESDRKSLPSPKEIKSFKRPLYDLDLKETDDKLIAYVDMPGVNKEDIQLKITDDGIEIKVEKKEERKEEKEGYIKEERDYKGFYRKMGLPGKIDPDATNAVYKDGILEITMPKVEKKMLTKGKRLEIR